MEYQLVDVSSHMTLMTLSDYVPIDNIVDHHHTLLTKTMAAPWPQWLTNSFVSANQPQLADDGSVYCGPYTRLLYHLFGIEGPFEISPHFYRAHDSIDVVTLFVVELNKHPVLFIEGKAPGSFTLNSKRKEADDQMRDRFRALRNGVVTPRLPGISAFGTRLAFYEYVSATSRNHGSLRLRLYPIQNTSTTWLPLNDGATTSVTPTVPLEFARWLRTS